MDFPKMKLISPELARLEASAETAGANRADWMATLFAVHEALSKCCGRGALDERLQTAKAYELARAALFAAWARGINEHEEIIPLQKRTISK